MPRKKKEETQPIEETTQIESNEGVDIVNLPIETPKRPRGRPRKLPREEQQISKENFTQLPSLGKEDKMRGELKKLYRDPEILQSYKKSEMDVKKIPIEELEDRLEQAQDTQKNLVNREFDDEILSELVGQVHNGVVRRLIVDVDISEDLKEDKLFMKSLRDSVWVFDYLPSWTRTLTLYGLHVLVGIKKKMLDRSKEPKEEGEENANNQLKK